MELPKELYTQLYIFADDINTTKALRLLCKISLSASYDYFNIILRTKIPIYYIYKEDIWVSKLNPYCFYFGQYTTNPIRKDISIITTIKDLYKKK